MPFVGLFKERTTVSVHAEEALHNAKQYIQLLNDDIYFFTKIKHSKKLQAQYFVNIYFWTFKWINQSQSSYIDQILDTDSALVKRYTANLNALYLNMYRNKDELDFVSVQVDEKQNFTNRPSILSFNWMTILAAYYYSGGIAAGILKNWRLYKKPLLEFLTKNVWQSVLWEPIIKIFKTLNDYDSKELSMVASDYTLSNEKESLQEQYRIFLANNNTQKIPEEANYNDDELEKNFLHLYNDIVNKPWVSLVKGDLITVLMITLQRVKLEANVSLSSIDKLIQSQNLLIKMIGITPAVMILYSTYKFIIKPLIYDAPVTIFSNLIQFIKGQLYILNNSKKNISEEYKLLYCRLLNNEKFSDSGDYFVVLDSLYELGLANVPKQLHSCWIDQIKKLLYTEDSSKSMLEIMAMDSAYGVYFK